MKSHLKTKLDEVISVVNQAAKSESGINDAIAHLMLEEMLSVDIAAREVEVKHELSLLRKDGAGGNVYDNAGECLSLGGGCSMGLECNWTLSDSLRSLGLALSSIICSVPYYTPYILTITFL